MERESPALWQCLGLPESCRTFCQQELRQPFPLTSRKQSNVVLWEGQASGWALGDLGNCKSLRADPPKTSSFYRQKSQNLTHPVLLVLLLLLLLYFCRFGFVGFFSLHHWNSSGAQINLSAGRGTQNHSVNRLRNGQGATPNMWIKAKAPQTSPCPSGMSSGAREWAQEQRGQAAGKAGEWCMGSSLAAQLD